MIPRERAAQVVDLTGWKVLAGRPQQRYSSYLFPQGCLLPAGAVLYLKSPWLRFFLSYDPRVAQVKVPVLALLGELDVQVDAEQNRAGLEGALVENDDVTIVVFPRANHLFLKAVTGGLEEYATLPKEFVPGFFEDDR